MRCRWIEQQLPLAAGDDLPPLKGWVVRRHVRRCDACRAELDRLKSVSRLAAQALESEPPETGSILESVLLALPPAEPPAVQRPLRHRGWALALSAMAAAVVLTLWVVRRPSNAPIVDAGPDLPIVAEAPENTTVMTFQTDDPQVTIVWFFQNGQTPENGGST